jgi:hypothetical protein
MGATPAPAARRNDHAFAERSRSIATLDDPCARRRAGGGAFKTAERLIRARRCDCRSAFDLFDRYLSRPL